MEIIGSNKHGSKILLRVHVHQTCHSQNKVVTFFPVTLLPATPISTPAHGFLFLKTFDIHQVFLLITCVCVYVCIHNVLVITLTTKM